VLEVGVWKGESRATHADELELQRSGTATVRGTIIFIFYFLIFC